MSSHVFDQPPSFEPLDFQRRSRIPLLVAIFGGLLIALGAVLLETELKLSGRGFVSYKEESKLFAPSMQSILHQIHADPGDKVKKGGLLLTLVNTDLKQQAQRARQNLAQLKQSLLQLEQTIEDKRRKPVPIEYLNARKKAEILKNIHKSQTSLVNRFEKLVNSGGISRISLHDRKVEKWETEQQLLNAEQLVKWMEQGVAQWELDKVVARRDQLLQRIDHAKKQLKLIKEQQNALDIRAPRRGTLLAIHPDDPGELIEEGEPLATVADTDSPYVVKAHLPERNIDLLQTGLPVRMESEVFQSSAEGYVTGHVTKFYKDPIRNPRTESPTYEVHIEVDSTPLPLVHGSSMQVEVIVGERSLLEMLILKRGSAE